MNRASSHPASRAAQKLMSERPCNCGQSLELEKRQHAAREHLVMAIVYLGGVTPFTPAVADLALKSVREALATLGSESK